MKRKHNAVLGEQAANLLSQLRAGTDHPALYPVQSLQVLLLDGFTRHETHARTAYRFADRLGVVGIVLLRLQLGLDKPRSHQPKLVPAGSEHTSPAVSTLR